MASLLAAFALGRYPLNRQTMDAIRARLEESRGTV
jgi:Na+/melibiose symporter-like transporter